MGILTTTCQQMERISLQQHIKNKGNGKSTENYEKNV